MYIYMYIYIYTFFSNSESVGFKSPGPGTNARPAKPEQSWNLAETFCCRVAKLGQFMPCAFHISYMPAFNVFSVWAELSSLLNFQKRQLQMNFEGVKVNWVPRAYLHKGKGSQRWCYSFQDIGPGQSTLGSRNL